MARSSDLPPSFNRVGDLLPRALGEALVTNARYPLWPQSNFTMSPNALLEFIIVSDEVTLAEVKMLCYTLRETIGWIDRIEGRRRWTLPITLQELAEVFGVGRTSLTAAVKRLTADSVIFSKGKSHTQERSYRLNPEWIAQIERSRNISRETAANVPETGRPCSSVNDASPETEQTTQRIIARINALRSNKETR